MPKRHVNLLLIDDDETSLKLLAAYLDKDYYHLTLARNGQEALDLIRSHAADFFSCIISDFIMPKMNGLELLNTLKQEEAYQNIPFILQTSSGNDTEIKKGLDAGAFYYLIKPYQQGTLLSVVSSALKDFFNRIELQAFTTSFTTILPLVTQAHFKLKTIEEAKSLASILSLSTAHPEQTSLGFFEIISNAIEHGNLGITYDEKTQLINEHQHQKEIARRLQSPLYQDKFVQISTNNLDDRKIVTVTDMGKGFDFKNYLEFSVDRAMDNHGRGIMMANKLSFDELIYSNEGRTATCIIYKHKT